MKRQYEKPVAKKVTFDFEHVVAQSAQCGSGILLTHQVGTQCMDMTPDKAFATYWLDPNKCGYQTNPN